MNDAATESHIKQVASVKFNFATPDIYINNV